MGECSSVCTELNSEQLPNQYDPLARKVKDSLSRWVRYVARAKKWGDKHCVMYLTVLPGADTSYRQISEGQSLCPPLDCPTWGRYELQAKK